MRMLQSSPCKYPIFTRTTFRTNCVYYLRLPLTSKFHDKYVPKSVIAKLTASKSEFHTAQAVSPPFEDIANPRNYTMWKQPGLSAGGVQIDGNVVGGAARNPGAFVPASIIWQTGVEGTGVSWLNVSFLKLSFMNYHFILTGIVET